MRLDIEINGEHKSVETDRAQSLLAFLREDLGLTGTKYGCGEGECGACTVLMNGKAVRSCITPVTSAEKKSITTIEGLERDGNLHPVQRAFLQQGAMQCGYCIPGMIMNAVALLNETPQPTREEIIRAMNGNICRCCAYPAILGAIERVAGTAREEKQ